MKLINYFEKLQEKQKLTHAFLIGNVLFDDIKEEIENVLKNIFFKNNIENINDNPDVQIYNLEDCPLTKEITKQMINNMSLTSQFNNMKVYIINEVDKLNDFIINSLLKTLEEPQDGIYIILLSNNIESVKSTIISRCQKIFLSQKSKILDETIQKLTKEFLNSINNKEKYLDNKLYLETVDRKTLKNVFRNLIYIYKNKLDNEMKNNCSKEELMDIINKIITIDNNIWLLDNYLNKNLFIDRFLIEMWGC